MNPFPMTVPPGQGAPPARSISTPVLPIHNNTAATPPPPPMRHGSAGFISHLFRTTNNNSPVNAAAPSSTTPVPPAAATATTSNSVFSFGVAAGSSSSGGGGKPPLTSFRKRRTSMDDNAAAAATAATLDQLIQSKYFNEKELANLSKQFHAWTNKQGKMDREGFRKSLGLLGMVQDALLCHQLFRVFNRSNTGQIDFDEYCIGLGVLMKGSMEEKLDFSFNMTDMDGSGSISFEELVLAVDSMRRIYAGVMGVQSPALDQEKIRRVFKVIDSDGNGRISLDEYKTAMKRNPEFLHTLRGIELFRPTSAASLLQANKRIERLEQVLDSVLVALNQYEDDLLTSQDQEPAGNVALLLHHIRNVVEPAIPTSQHVRKHDTPTATEAAVSAAAEERFAASTPPSDSPSSEFGNGGGGGGEIRAKASSNHSLSDLVSVKSKGAVVSFGHKNWDLVVNVMKGIQMAVSRSAMEADREVSPYDYSVKEKYTLVSTLDPELQHDASNRTRFVDYAPFVFAKLRQRFKINHEEYMNSIGPGSMLSNLMLGSLSSLSELGSEGKSGSFFYLSSDNRFFVKTVRRDEHKWLRQILPSYYRHMTEDTSGTCEESLLTRMVGCHVVRRSTGTNKSSTLAQKVYFVVMTNALITDLEVDRKYDLKGSWVGRRTKLAPGADLANKTLKDLDLKESRKDRIFVDKEMKEKLMATLRRDVNFLEQHQIIDYSVLLGVHDHTVPVNVAAVAAAAAATPPAVDEDDRGAGSCFNSFHGGFLSADGKQTYLVGIIDFLTRYSKTKQVEHAFKTVAYFNNRNGISVMPARAYAKRFLDFMENTVIIDAERDAYFAESIAQASARSYNSLLRRFSV